MKTDRYIKLMLTVIACCQVISVLSTTQILKPALADSPVHVIVDSFSSFAFQWVEPIRVRN